MQIARKLAMNPIENFQVVPDELLATFLEVTGLSSGERSFGGTGTGIVHNLTEVNISTDNKYCLHWCESLEHNSLQNGGKQADGETGVRQGSAAHISPARDAILSRVKKPSSILTLMSLKGIIA